MSKKQKLTKEQQEILELVSLSGLSVDEVKEKLSQPKLSIDSLMYILTRIDDRALLDIAYSVALIKAEQIRDRQTKQTEPEEKEL